jgi:hypothetical protein
MIAVPAGAWVLVATNPVDFRWGAGVLPPLRVKSCNVIPSRGQFSSSARKERIV